MKMTAEQFQNECGPHIEALRDLIERMPEQGLVSEDSQKVGLSIALTELERSIDSVEPFDFVDLQGYLNPECRGLAEKEFNQNPDSELFLVDVNTEVGDQAYDLTFLVCVQAGETLEGKEGVIRNHLGDCDDFGIEFGNARRIHPRS